MPLHHGDRRHLLKVYAWYDNEMGYACRMVDLAMPHGSVSGRHLTWQHEQRHHHCRRASHAQLRHRHRAYWGFTLTDGALRMLVLLHFYKLGYSPFTLAFLFLLYEAAGIAGQSDWRLAGHALRHCQRMLVVGLS
jgi:hypothetical protein